MEPRDDSLEGHELFGAFATLAFIAERAKIAGDIDDTLAGLDRSKGWLTLLTPWIRRRYTVEEPAAALPTLPMDRAMADAVERWSEGQWSSVLP